VRGKSASKTLWRRRCNGAAQRADALVAGSDSEGCTIWKRILADVAELARPAPPEGERVN
jgi:hypothetical protein